MQLIGVFTWFFTCPRYTEDRSDAIFVWLDQRRGYIRDGTRDFGAVRWIAVSRDGAAPGDHAGPRHASYGDVAARDGAAHRRGAPGLDRGYPGGQSGHLGSRSTQRRGI